MFTKKKTNILIYIFILGALLRLIGIDHGFPFIFHPDEPAIVRSALAIRFDPNPKHFDWPHLYIYANYFLYMGFAKLRNLYEVFNATDFFRQHLPIILDDNLIFYLLTRIFSALLGALTAVPVYLTGKKLFGERAGVLAALCMAILPFHVHHSHYALSDVPMVFVLAWAIYFSAKILHEGRLGDYLLAGLFVGLAASTKYNGGLTALAVVVAHFMHIKLHKPLRKIHFAAASAVASVVGFLVGTPFALLDFQTFTRTDGPSGALWQFTNVGSRSFIAHVQNFFGSLLTRLSDDFGYVSLAVYLIMLLYLVFVSLKRKATLEERSLWLLFIPSLVLLWYISGFEKSRSHYFMIVYPFVAVVFGYGATRISVWAKRINMHLSTAVLILLFTPMLVVSALRVHKFYNGDTRQHFYEWAQTDMNKALRIFYTDQTMLEVLKEAGFTNRKKGVDNLWNHPEGYVVVFEGDVLNFPPDNRFERIYWLGNEQMLGPTIEGYHYKL
jgi:uncharacterized membrane protein